MEEQKIKAPIDFLPDQCGDDSDSMEEPLDMLLFLFFLKSRYVTFFFPFAGRDTRFEPSS